MLKPLSLKNGLTVLRLPKPGSNVFLTSFVATTGSVVEEGYFPLGISYLIERLFWCGTDKHTSTRSLNLTLEGMGGSYSSQTTQELTQYYINVPSYHQFKAISMMSEVIQRSYFDLRDIEREKRAIVEDLKKFEDIIDADHTRLAMSNLYAKYNLGLPVEGTIDSIMSITQEDVTEYLAHQYRPDKSFLIMAGNFDNKAVMELVEQEWNFWSPRLKKHIEPFEFHKEDVDELPRVIYRQRGLAQTQIAFAFLLDEGMQTDMINEASKNPEIVVDTKVALEKMLTQWAQLLVLNSILGQGLSSRLWSKAVEEEMLFTNVASDIVRFKATGYLQISGTIDNSQFSFGLESVLSTLEGLKKTTVSINELLKAKEYLKGKLITDHEDLLTATSWQIENLVGSNLTFELQDLLEKIDQVEASAIRSLASDLFTGSRAAITTLGTAKETRLVDKLIRKYLS
jgi:predicted Zn-dependent peptidase